MLPASRPQSGIRRGDVQSFWADHQPVQSYKPQTFGLDDGPVFASLGGRYGGWIFRQREGSNFDALIAGFADGAAGIGEREFFKRFVADGVAKLVTHDKRFQCTGFLRATRISERPRQGNAGSMRRQIQTVLSNTFSANLLICPECSMRL